MPRFMVESQIGYFTYSRTFFRTGILPGEQKRGDPEMAFKRDIRELQAVGLVKSIQLHIADVLNTGGGVRDLVTTLDGFEETVFRYGQYGLDRQEIRRVINETVDKYFPRVSAIELLNRDLGMDIGNMPASSQMRRDIQSPFSGSRSGSSSPLSPRYNGPGSVPSNFMGPISRPSSPPAPLLQPGTPSGQNTYNRQRIEKAIDDLFQEILEKYESQLQGLDRDSLYDSLQHLLTAAVRNITGPVILANQEYAQDYVNRSVAEYVADH